jgi:predicted GH43/DUF377 family glycosyl hydrolase
MFSAMLLFPPVSADTSQWVKDPNNPVLTPTPGGWDAYEVLLPRLVYDGTIYRMWYHGQRSEQEGGKIGYATSQDGIKWSKHPDPVLLPGPTGDWDTYSLQSASVIWNGSLFMMWYRGWGPGFEEGAVGLAFSSDGVSWTKYAGNPVMKSSSIDKKLVSYPYVVWDGTEYKMWYTGWSGSGKYRIFLATSTDGIKWTKRTLPVLSTSASGWDAGSVYCPTIIFDGSSYAMWYSGTDSAQKLWLIGYATSKDGISWTKYAGNPILNQGPSGSWDSYDSLDNQGVVQVGNIVMLFYSADQVEGGRMVSYKIGLARSPEGFAIPEIPPQAFSILLGVLVFSATMILRRRRS